MQVEEEYKPRRRTTDYGSTEKTLNFWKENQSNDDDDDTESQKSYSKSDRPQRTEDLWQPGRRLAYEQGCAQVHQALQTPPPSKHFRAPADYRSGHDPAGPASTWDLPKVPLKAADHRRDEPEEGEVSDEEQERMDSGRYVRVSCSLCGKPGHQDDVCPDLWRYTDYQEAGSEGSDLPLLDLEGQMRKDGYEPPPPIEPYDPENPSTRACFHR